MTIGKSPRSHQLTQVWGGWIVRRAQWVLVTSLLLCAMLIPLALNATQHTVPDGWLPDSAMAVEVQQLTNEHFGRSDTTYYILFSDSRGALQANDPEFQQQVAFAVRPLRALDAVESVLTWGSTNNDLLNSMLLSDDGMLSLAIVTLTSEPNSHVGTPEWLRENLAETDLQTDLTGLPVVGDDFRIVGHNDLVRAELIALPITLILLVFIFRGVFPALIPIALAASSMIITLAAMAIMARFAPVSVFTVNTVTMLGLAVGIDYALIMVGRFREEMATSELETAIQTTIESAGTTVVTAASTVAIGLSGLFFFDVPAATTTALLGAMVVLVAMVLSLTAVPAALVLFSSNVVTERKPRTPLQFVPKLESARERHPVVTLALCIVILATLTAPILGMKAVSPGIANLPADSESRSTAERIRQDFSLASTSPIEIVIQPLRGSMLEVDNLQRYKNLSTRIETTPGVLRVESLWGYMPVGLSPRYLASSYILEPNLVMASQPFLTPSAALITIIPEPALSDDAAHELVRQLRDEIDASPPTGLQVMVGGALALDLDLIDHITQRTPIVLGWVLVLTAIVLFVHFRSALLPIKAIVMNLISMGASFGMLVWIFQDGHLAWLFGVDATGSTVMLVPVLMFSFLFGLGMDFEIIMLSRIRESWMHHGDTTRAVREGLRRAAGIVTASAVLMLTVFLAFAFSNLDVVKAVGIGLAISVAVDATIVRLLLLPATMQLMGKWNWWPGKRNPTD